MRLLILLTVAAATVAAGPSSASDPAEQSVTVPAAGQSTTITWTGTIPPASGGTATSSCNTSALVDEHVIHLAVPAGAYDSATTDAVFSITFTPADPTSDEIITVNQDGQEIGSGDTSETTETVSAANPKGGDFQVLACAFTGVAPQSYTGKLVLTSRPKVGAPGEVNVPSADAADCASAPRSPPTPSATRPSRSSPPTLPGACTPAGRRASPTRRTTPRSPPTAATSSTCWAPRRVGSRARVAAATAAWVSRPFKNASGDYQYAYAGLGPLTGFTTSTSPDGGRTLSTAGPQGNTNTARGGGADRQWITFLNASDALLSYNQQMPRNVVVQKSTDGGYSYITGNDTVAANNPDFPGPMGSMPERLIHPSAPASARIAYFGFNAHDADGTSYVGFAISDRTGLSWKNLPGPQDPRAGRQRRAGRLHHRRQRHRRQHLPHLQRAEDLPHLPDDPAGVQARRLPAGAHRPAAEHDPAAPRPP